MLQTLVPVGSRMAKKAAKIPQEVEHPRFKAGIPAMKRRAVLPLSEVKGKLQEIRDQLAMIDQCILTAEGLGVDSLYLDGATKPDLVSQQLFLFRQKVERAVHDLKR